MLSSIILSLAMNAAPVPTADLITLDVKEVGTKRKAIRLNSKFELEQTGTKRKAIRL